MIPKTANPAGESGARDRVGVFDISVSESLQAAHAEFGSDRRSALKLFAARCRQMVERVNAGAVPFIWAVDCLYDAAVWSGLADDLGDDVVQRVMADAFMKAWRS